MTLRAPWLAVAFLLSALVPLWESLRGVELVRGSHAALDLAPWLILAPFPRRGDAAEPLVRALLSVTSLLVAPLGLAVGLDLARGAAPLALALGVGAGVASLLLWTAAAELAVRAESVRGLQSALWFGAFPGSAALASALLFAPRSAAQEPARLASWIALNPLAALLRWGRPGGLADLDPAGLLLSILAAGLALALVRARSLEHGPSSP